MMSNSNRESSNSPCSSAAANDAHFRATLDALLDFDNSDGSGCSNDGGSQHGDNDGFKPLQQQPGEPQLRKPGDADSAPPTNLSPQQQLQQLLQQQLQQLQQLPQSATTSIPGNVSLPTLSSGVFGSIPCTPDITGIPLFLGGQDEGTINFNASSQAQNLQISTSQPQQTISTLSSVARAASAALMNPQAIISTGLNATFPMSAPAASAATTSSTAAAISSLPPPQTYAQITPVPAPTSFDPTKMAAATSRKRRFDIASTISEDDSERDRRRQDRNLREQQRSQQITHQIAHLREVLVAANVASEKTDKYSVLVTVGDYIRQLQESSTTLDAQHVKLVETINETSKIINEQYVAAQNASLTPMPVSSASADILAAQEQQQDEGMIPGFDYKSIFVSCPLATSITNIDGRFIDCNQGFEDLSGYKRHELLPLEAQAEQGSLTGGSASQNLSLFNVIKREDMETVFVAMSDILKRPMISQEEPSLEDTWIGDVEFCREAGVTRRLSISLVRTSGGRPRFFNCLFLPDDSSDRSSPPSMVTLPALLS